MRIFDNATSIITLILAFLGIGIGFLNEEYRVLAWSVSLIVTVILLAFLIFGEYGNRLENNERKIGELEKDLNINNRLIKLETLIEGLLRKK